MRRAVTAIVLLLLAASAFPPSPQAAQGSRRKGQKTRYDVLIKGGTVYDGTGASPVRADVAIKGDRIAAIGDLKSADARPVINAGGLAVAPGFINMLSWSVDTLIIDGRSQGEIRQGVTTEIFGEGDSRGPLTQEMQNRW